MCQSLHSRLGAAIVFVLALASMAAPYTASAADGEVPDIAKLAPEPSPPVKTDWLVMPMPCSAGIYRGAHPQEILLSNGLIRRTWRLRPNAATVAYDTLMTGTSILRGVKPEATRLQQRTITKINIRGVAQDCQCYR